jgi:hypothetical protein
MLPLFWRNLYFKIHTSTALLGLCLSTLSFAQTIPEAQAVNYPGMIEHFEKLIQVVNDRYHNRQNFLLKNGKSFSDTSEVTALELEPDFLNSIILHSDQGYMKLAASSKCRFYDAIITDLLRSTEGKIKNVHVTYVSRTGKRESAIMNRKDFLHKVVNLECPESKQLIDQFQVRNLDQTLQHTRFENPAGKDHCANVHLGWLNNPKTPYLCQMHEYLKEVRLGQGDPADLAQRRGVAKVLASKLGSQLDYLETLCTHLDEPTLFCQQFLNTSFWSKISAGHQPKIFAEDICRQVAGRAEISEIQLKQCLNRLNKEEDLCLYPGGRSLGILPQPNCKQLSTALNHSSLRANYRDCPQASDQQVLTNMGRLLLHLGKNEIKNFSGSCSSIPAGVMLDFNKRFDNEEKWQVQACYQDKVHQKEVCHRTYFGEYGNQPESITQVVAKILKATRGADNGVTCQLLDSQDYNPLLLNFKSGCFVVYEREKCFLTKCQPRVIFNDRQIDLITFKGQLKFDYFPLSVRDERFSQQYLLTTDYQKKGRSLTSLPAIRLFFGKSKSGIIHGVGCAEELLPTFYKARSINQCSPLPFLIDGMIDQADSATFVTRTAIDSLQAPRLIPWSNILAGLKSYQRQHPLRTWTLYGLD